jgi:hypothetical protein
MNKRCPPDLSEFPPPKQPKGFRFNLELEDYINNYQASYILVPISPVQVHGVQIETDLYYKEQNMSLKYVSELKIFLYQTLSLWIMTTYSLVEGGYQLFGGKHCLQFYFRSMLG